MRLLEQAQAAAQRIQQLGADARIRIVVPPDADGVAAAAVAVRMLLRAKRQFHVTYTRDVDDALIESMRSEADEATIFAGLGHGFFLFLNSLPGALIVVDDEKVSAPATKQGRILHLNPRFDPAMPKDAASASTMMFALAAALDMTNQDLAAIALLGAYAKGQQEPDLRGWNKDVFDTAVERGLLANAVGVGLPEAPLVDVLRTLPTNWRPATHDLEDSAGFLTQHGLAPDVNLHELGRSDLEQFTSLVVVRGLQRGVAAKHLAELFRNVPRSTKHGDLPLPRLVNLVASAAAEAEAGLALQFLLGDLALLSDLERLESKHHEPHHSLAHGHKELGP